MSIRVDGDGVVTKRRLPTAPFPTVAQVLSSPSTSPSPSNRMYGISLYLSVYVFSPSLSWCLLLCLFFNSSLVHF